MTDDGHVPALHAEGLAKTFGGVRALKGVDLTIQHGEVQALLGENGSGKSTFIKILSGYHVPGRGRSGRHRRSRGHLRLRRVGLHARLPVRPPGPRAGRHVVGAGQHPPQRRVPVALRHHQGSGGDAQRAGGPARGSASSRSTPAPRSPRSRRRSRPVSRSPGHCATDVHHPARLLVLDEPTATLPVDEVDHLLASPPTRGHGRRGAVRDPPPRKRIRPRTLGVPRRQGRRRGPGVRVRPCPLDRLAARRRGTAHRGERDPAPQVGRAAARTHETVFVRPRSPRRRGRGISLAG